MHHEEKRTFKTAWQVALKIAIAVLAFWFIYKQVIQKENLADVLAQYKEVAHSDHKDFLVAIVFLLMLLNWSLEALKWKFMMRKLETISFFKSLEAVFSGLTISFFTPNRIGEYAGRVFHLRIADRIKATLITVFENISQLLVTLVVGSLSLIFYLHQYVGLNYYLQTGVAVLLLTFAAGILLLFFYLPVLDSSLLKANFLKRFKKYLEVLAEYSRMDLLKVVVLALLRYIVFSTQYFLLLLIFGIDVSYTAAILLLNMVFFVMTLVPTFALTEIGVRGAVATYFLGMIASDKLAILNASISLWLINLVIPAIIGIIFIFQFRFDKHEV